MKKVLLSALATLGLGSMLHAQNFVSTTAENKNVVLEEFTGIYCTWCPDGHLRANNFKATSPNDIFLINIHTGGFASPSGGDPDFRTNFGTALANQSDLAGYPAGTINRRNFPGNVQNGSPATATAQSRGTWATTGATVLAESSPVNVAAVATIDFATRELEVIVETYFTAAAGTAPYKLNVALLQNNVEGPQTGATRNPSAILPNGNYNHQHMLRHMLTGQWGIDVTSTAMGYFQVDTFRYTIPTGFTYQTSAPVAANLVDMEVVVFVAEGQQTIITGNQAAMTFNLPPGTSLATANVSSNSITNTSYCSYDYTPAVTVTNSSTDTSSTIDSVLVSYTVNGGTATTQWITTSLAPNGGSTPVTFPMIQLPAGENVVEYNIDFASYNSNLLDASSSSDLSITEGPFPKLPANSSATPISEGFQGLAFGVSSPAGAIADNPSGGLATVVTKSSFNVTQNIGGNGNSDGAFFWDFYGVQSPTPMKLVWHKLDLTNTMGSKLVFTRAHAQYSTENDRLKINVSTDCNATSATVWDRQGAQLATAPVHGSSRFVPTVTEWVTDTVDLSAYDGMDDVVITFEAISAFGNSLYVDDINTISSNAINVVAVEAPTTSFKVFPNPVRNTMTVNFEVADATDLNISIQNALGQTVQQVANQNFFGETTLTVNTSNLPAGVYFVNAVSETGVITKRFVVER